MNLNVRVICRRCGVWGYEDADDPCPGLCPRCFEEGLEAETVALDEDMDNPALSDQDVSRRHGERLRALGMPRGHVERLLQEERRLVAARGPS